MNDLVLKIDGQKIVCEVKGVTSGTRHEYISQIQKHIIRYSSLTKQPVNPGLLILNYQRDKPPDERSAFYSDVASQELAKTSGIGLLDTRELFKICKKIYLCKNEEKNKIKARELLCSYGVISSDDLNLDSDTSEK